MDPFTPQIGYFRSPTIFIGVLMHTLIGADHLKLTDAQSNDMWSTKPNTFHTRMEKMFYHAGL